MPFLDLLTSEHVRTDLVAVDKSDLLAKIAMVLAVDPSEQREIHEALLERERLGSTGLGRGVAIPHGRMPGIERARAVFIKLHKPLAFDAADAEPIDLVAALVMPAHFTDQHLHLLAELAEMFSDERLTSALRAAADASTIIAKLAEFAGERTREIAWTD